MYTYNSTADAHGVLGEALLRFESLGPLVLEPFVVLEEGHELFGFLAHIESLVLVVLHILKVLESLNGEDILLTLLCHLFAAGLDDVVQQDQRLVHVAPVLAVIVKAFPDHLHDLGERDDVVGEICDLRHEGARGPPGVVRGGLPHPHLCIGEVQHHILEGSSHRHCDFFLFYRRPR